MIDELLLFQRDDCHLCDLAMDVLLQAGVADFESIWIDDDPTLQARYGQYVPVLRNQITGEELCWPFDAAGVTAIMVKSG